jgi:F0F1-type ATP synthase membrane subunit b/b'
MEFLQNLFGNLSSGVIRLAVAVGIIVAVGIFIVKPVLETTEKTVESTNHQIEKSVESANLSAQEINEKVNKTVEEANKQVQEQVESSFHAANAQGGLKKTEKLLHCIQRAHQNVHRIERCSKKFS